MKYRIGEFSKLGRVPVTTLRFYDEAGILKPRSVGLNHYRYYDASQLAELNTITGYRRAGLTIEDIQRIRVEGDPVSVIDERIRVLESDLSSLQESITMLRDMRDGVRGHGYEMKVKEIPAVTTAYRKGRLEDQSGLTGFVLEFADICGKQHPDIECTEDGQCFVVYDDMEYREKDIGIQYHQVVKRALEPSSEIGFAEFGPTLAVCVEHKGPYDRLNEAYAAAIAWLEEKGLELSEPPRESYIHGCWDMESEEDYLTEIIFPVDP